MFQSLILCSAPRSGSTLFCDLLAGTGVAGRPASYFRRQSIPGYARRLDVPTEDVPKIDKQYLDAILKKGTDGSGRFGLRLMWETFPELVESLDAIFPGLPGDLALMESAFGRVLYVHLTRADKVAQAVSLAKAQQTGLWHRYADGSERERTDPAKPAAYDRDLLTELVAELTVSDEGWSCWFAERGIEPVCVTYEDLNAEPRCELAKVLRALGEDPAIADRAEIVSAKMADAVSRSWADRFRREVSS